MDGQVFFNHIRRSIFDGSLSQPQVSGITALLDTFDSYQITNIDHAAYILANVHHETGGYMSPIKETVYASHKDKNPSDATVIARLDRAYAQGQLTWVTKPYWREGWFGRGMVQITHKDNYDTVGEAIGVDLIADRDRALELETSAAIAVVGMYTGLFTGKKLSDYNFPTAVDAPSESNPRRIINGKDGTDGKIANTYRLFYSALKAAGFGEVSEPVEQTPVPQVPTRTRSVILAEIDKLVDELKAMENT